MIAVSFVDFGFDWDGGIARMVDWRLLWKAALGVSSVGFGYGNYW